jgi:hypothetical protein
MVDYLTEDTIIPTDQKFVCISFLSDKDNKKTLSGIKIRGVFATYELACEHSKKLQNIDTYFNVFVGEMGKWLPFDPNPEEIKDSEYANEQLNTLMKSYLENQEKAKIFHEQRKNEMVRQNIVENLSIRKDNLSDIKKKYHKTKHSDDKTNMENTIKTLEEEIEKMELKKTDLDDQLSTINEQINNFSKTVLPPKIIDYEN